MAEAWDYPRALQELWDRSSYERGLISDPFGDVARAERGLVRMRALLAELGDPQQHLPMVHIAGSKGKGSTAAFIAACASRAGHRVGLYTSPHLHRFPERIAVDGDPLPDVEFAAVAAAVAAGATRLESLRPDLGQVTTFEFVTAMAFLAFSRHSCDLAVVEVGLGGRFDATNVIAPIVSVITRIDLEHTAVLGPTHAAIAWQKAGIMQPTVPAVSSPQVPAAAAVLTSAAAEIGSPLFMAERDWTWAGSWSSFTATGPWGTWPGLRLGVAGPHQIENACTAIAALHVVAGRGIPVPEAAVRAGLAETRWPGRFEHLRRHDRDIVLDGAHTPAAAAALLRTWRETFAGTAATVILGMGSDKDPRAFLAVLAPLVNRLIATRSRSPRAIDPKDIADAAGCLGIACEIQPTVAAALDRAEADQTGPLLVTGSLFVAGEAREALGLAAPDLDWEALNTRVQSPTPNCQNRA
jgi:dihydrofolate synthase/folylpolyglutamate synthase